MWASKRPSRSRPRPSRNPTTSAKRVFSTPGRRRYGSRPSQGAWRSPPTESSSATNPSSSRSYPTPSRSWLDRTTSRSRRSRDGRHKGIALRGGRGPRGHPRDGALRRGDHARRAVAAAGGAVPGALPHARHFSLRLHGEYVRGEARVAPGDEVAVLPPVSGG